MSQLLAAAVAYLVYPGFLAVLLAGMIGAWADGRGARLPDLRRLLRRPPLLVLAAALLGSLAAAQAGAPFSPLGSVDRNVLVAAVAVAAAAALGVDPGWSRRAPALMLGLAAWMVGLLVPAALAGDVHPGVLASLAFGPAVAIKAAAAVLYVAGGAALLEAAGDDVRHWLWLPVAALFASIFVPASPDDAAGLLAFFGATFGALAVMLALGFAARRLPQLQTR